VMPKADLPTVRWRIQHSRQHFGKVLIPAVDLDAVLAELEAARQVVEAGRELSAAWDDQINAEERDLDDGEAFERVVAAIGALRVRLAAYHQAVA
jgi:hypothetical protein